MFIYCNHTKVLEHGRNKCFVPQSKQCILAPILIYLTPCLSIPNFLLHYRKQHYIQIYELYLCHIITSEIINHLALRFQTSISESVFLTDAVSQMFRSRTIDQWRGIPAPDCVQNLGLQRAALESL